MSKSANARQALSAKSNICDKGFCLLLLPTLTRNSLEGQTLELILPKHLQRMRKVL